MPFGAKVLILYRKESQFFANQSNNNNVIIIFYKADIKINSRCC